MVVGKIKKKKQIFLENFFLKQKSIFFFKKHRKKQQFKKTFKKNLKEKSYNFSKIWFIKFNNYVVLSTFVFFYLKLRRKKKQIFQKNKANKLFWKKKRGLNLKRKQFLQNLNFVF